MTKRLAVLVCLLGITSASIPAHANSTTKKITLACSSFAPNVITGAVTVALCEASPASDCSGATFECPALACDSSGASADLSTTIFCAAPFKVDAVTYDESYTDDVESVLSSGTSSGTHTLGKGKIGFVSTQLSGSGDKVIIEVK